MFELIKIISLDEIMSIYINLTKKYKMNITDAYQTKTNCMVNLDRSNVSLPMLASMKTKFNSNNNSVIQVNRINANAGSSSLKTLVKSSYES